MTPTDPTSRAADLAELILDQVSSADQDWHLGAICARELADRAWRHRPDTAPGEKGVMQAAAS